MVDEQDFDGDDLLEELDDDEYLEEESDTDDETSELDFEQVQGTAAEDFLIMQGEEFEDEAA